MVLLIFFGTGCIGKLYADDIKLYSIWDNPSGNSGYSDLQGKLNDLQQWSDIRDSSKFHIKSVVRYT